MQTVKNQCGICKNKYKLAADNTSVNYFPKWPGMSYFETECPTASCENVEWIFFIYSGEVDPDKEITLKTALASGFPVHKHEELPLEILESYETMQGERLPQPMGLLPRHESLLAVLRWELETATVEDILGTDIEVKLPRRWV
jgi:hypothetical protein